MNNKPTPLILAALLFLLFSACSKEQQAQEDTQSLDFILNFVGTGKSVTIDSVKVENINTSKHVSLKGGENLRLVSSISASTKGQKLMQYSYRDKLKITGKSGLYCTIINEVISESKSIVIPFVDCTDADKNNYPVVKIGDRFWMAENLRTTKSRSGTKIPFYSNLKEWYMLDIGAFCFYDNSSINGQTYGNLYNWYALKNNSIAPYGWHIPTKDEWKWLMEDLGGQNQIGGMLKESGTIHWNSPNKGATNATGFSALPGGMTLYSSFEGIGETACWWSSNETEDQYGIPLLQGVSFNIDNNYESLSIKLTEDKRHGLSIRCIKDL